MRKAKIVQELYDKMQQEYANFISELKGKSPDEILERAYEKVVKDEILIEFCSQDSVISKYNMDQIMILSKCNYPLETIYQDWLDYNIDISELIENSIKITLEVLEKNNLKRSKERIR